MISKSTTSMTPHGLSPATVWVVPVRRMSGSAARTAVAGVRGPHPRSLPRRGRAPSGHAKAVAYELLLVGPPPPETCGTVAQKDVRRKRRPVPCARLRSDHPGRGGVGLEQDRPIDPEFARVRRPTASPRRRPSSAEDPTEDRGELEPVRRRRARRRRPGASGSAIDDEVAIRRERVQAGLRVDRRAERARQMGRHEALDAREGRLVPLERPVVRLDRLAAAVLGGLRSGLAVRREAVEATARPSRSRPGSGPGAKAAGSGQAKYVTCSLVTSGQPPVECGEQLVRPGVGGEDDPPGPMVAVGGLDLESPPPASRIAVTGSARGASRRSPASRGGRRCPGSGRPGRPRAWHIAGAHHRAATAASAAHSAASSSSNGTPSAVRLSV